MYMDLENMEFSEEALWDMNKMMLDFENIDNSDIFSNENDGDEDVILDSDSDLPF